METGQYLQQTAITMSEKQNNLQTYISELSTSNIS